DIILWALSVSDPYNILVSWNADKAASTQFLKSLDNDFKYHLDRYKYAARFEPKDKKFHRDLAMLWIENTEVKLSEMPYLSGKTIGIYDYMCLPFIRQFRIADPDWFDSQKLPNLHKHLSQFLESDLFKQVMQKMPIWKKTGIETEF
ncbi:MAG: glutathione S-transferase, partial [Alphaproteobacteria bacterium]